MTDLKEVLHCDQLIKICKMLCCKLTIGRFDGERVMSKNYIGTIFSRDSKEIIGLLIRTIRALL